MVVACYDELTAILKISGKRSDKLEILIHNGYRDQLKRINGFRID